MTATACAACVDTVIKLYLALPGSPRRALAQDRAVARRWCEQGVPLAVIEAGLLLASLRRRLRPADAWPLPPVRSLAYFQPVIAEVQQQPLAPGYLDYLRSKLRDLGAPTTGSVQKSTFSHAR